MAIYTIDPRLPGPENKRRALALHEQDGHAVPVYGEGGYLSHFLFPDGAVQARDPSAMPTEPVEVFDEDRREVLRRRHQYWKIRTERATKEFVEFKRQVEAQHSPTPGGLRKLEALAEVVRRCRGWQEHVESKLNPTFQPPIRQDVDQLADAEKRRQEAERQQLKQKVGAINP
jgi:hypothetical protein